MSKQVKNNLVYFECSSMRELYGCLKTWQDTNQQSFLSISIHQDNGMFCCIALVDFLIQPKSQYEEDMARFQRKALNNIGVGIDFINSSIPPEKVSGIQSKLVNCKTAEQVRAVFRQEFQ